VAAISDAIAERSTEIFKELDRIQGGVAEVGKLDKAL